MVDFIHAYHSRAPEEPFQPNRSDVESLFATKPVVAHAPKNLVWCGCVEQALREADAQKRFIFPVVQILRRIALAAEIKALLEKGALEPAPSSPGFYSRIFVAPKSGGSWRPIIDLSSLNRFIISPKFHMETSQLVLRSVRRDDWMISVDLKDAYLQVPVHPESRKFLRFSGPTGTFQFRVLCFGLTTAPQVFTRVMSPISEIMHCQGFRMRRYLDDWLVQALSVEEVLQARDFLLNLKKLEYHINLGKSSLIPAQTKTYLGITIQTRLLRAFPTEERVLAILSQLETFRSNRSQPVSLWKSLLGRMASLSLLIPGSRLRMRSLQACLRNRWFQEEHVHGLGRFLPEDLRWWSEEYHLTPALDWTPHSDFHLYTVPRIRVGEQPQISGQVRFGRIWMGESINHEELRAIEEALIYFSPVEDPMLFGTDIMLHSWNDIPSIRNDSTSVDETQELQQHRNDVDLPLASRPCSRTFSIY
ncbi:uncharacterized protein [Macrobrachium rosenbergii]|uniref:uncharacterized protein n=1 Tax=Macrobrachium rosenbergii TaxID=79674 RepID=UPI0034D4ABF9